MDCKSHHEVVAENRFIRQVLILVGKLYQTTFIFPENPGYATVYGAAVNYRYDMLGKPKPFRATVDTR